MRYSERVKNLKDRLKREKLNGLLVTKRENIAYLSGFKGEDGTLLITDCGSDYIITDARFGQEADEKLTSFRVRLLNKKCPYAIVRDLAKRHKIRRLGFESNALAYGDYVNFERELARTYLVPKRSLVEDLRIIKDACEIISIKKSAGILKKVFRYVEKNITGSLTGEKLAILIDNRMRKCGASQPAFQTIVAQNPYSSQPHACATNLPLGSGSAVLVDMGAVFEGYNSDLTRIIFLGRITSKFKRIYNIIKSAQALALEKIRPGISAAAVDRAARNYIIRRGLGKFFLHSLGHGIGLEIHEPPQVSKNSGTILRPGMVFTVEPGIYIRGWGGLRIEDMVAVTENGCEVLTNDIPK